MDGVNEEVELGFYPVGGFSNPKINKTVTCPPVGADKDCQGDKYESCLLHTFCGGVSCKPKEQLQLAHFLDCFEGEHQSAIDKADGCATAAGFDTSKVSGCLGDETAKEAAFAAVQTAAGDMSRFICFPWIEVDGQVESKDPQGGCFGPDAGTYPLLPIICAAAKAAGAPTPKACDPGSAAVA